MGSRNIIAEHVRKADGDISKIAYGNKWLFSTRPSPILDLGNGVAIVTLSRNKFAWIDSADVEAIGIWRWHAISSGGQFIAGRRCRVTNKVILMHRDIIKPSDELDVDHKNGCSLDNRRDNLRACTHLENSRNKKKHKNNTSGYKGVYCHRDGYWFAAIKLEGGIKRLGKFARPREAALAYDRAAIEHFGAFAHLNFRRSA